MKKILPLVFIALSTRPVYADHNIDGLYALINDRDGYVNVREQDNLNSRVTYRLNNGTPVSANCEDMSPNKNFCWVFFDKSRYGYVYKNRLNFLTPNAVFSKIPLIRVSADKTEGIFGNGSATVKIQFAPANLDLKNFDAQQSDAFGIDNTDPLERFYRLQNIQVHLNNKVITIPHSAMRDVYLSRHLLKTQNQIADIGIYQNKQTDQLYIIGSFADGALAYSVVYEIKDGKFFRKSIWSEV